MSLQLFDPDQLPVLDPVEERAGELLHRVEIQRQSHAGKIFMHLYRAAGCGPGVVRGVESLALRAASGASESGVRKWLALLTDRGLIRIEERGNRFMPRNIHVLEAIEDRQATLPGFTPKPSSGPTSIAVVTVHNESFAPGAHRCGIGSVPVRTDPAPVRMSVANEVPHESRKLRRDLQADDESQFTLPPELLEPLPGESVAQQMRRVAQARASNTQSAPPPIPSQTQPSNSASTPKEFGGGVQLVTVAKPTDPPTPLAKTMSVVMHRAEVTPAWTAERAAKLAAEIVDAVHDPLFELSREIILDACTRAVTGSTSDTEAPWTEGHIRAIVNKARVRADHPPSYIHKCLHKAFGKRNWPWPYGGSRPREPP